MNDLLSSLQSLDQDQALVALFVWVLVLSLGVAAVVAILRALGKWGVVALCLAGAAVCIALVR